MHVFNSIPVIMFKKQLNSTWTTISTQPAKNANAATAQKLLVNHAGESRGRDTDASLVGMEALRIAIAVLGK
eukprot:CAMPEP_0185752812 /NCGR_PEP_ID=MMETSP1174-20130828/11585_1 /TAXON_ID=35687 /ORGANISM="Dictyocha speculum, Strain CCMP1381" /LENGTH=71 /DNA_ID=CAMNT_0028430401 /DNA_START=712 /DNA_END=927 /DNA_ORIENTATION=+